ncbi:MAG: hypothetical protein QXR19_15690 [Candidatus Jordarchaeaceae archaeon]
MQKEDARNIIPKKKGIYAWFDKRSNEVIYIYIGRAVGKEGLYQRIVKQHLNEKYLKTDKNWKTSPKERF